MNNQEKRIRECMCLLNMAMQGSCASMSLNTKSPKQLLSKGYNSNEISISIELCNELERLIRDGESLAEAIFSLHSTGWANHIIDSIEGDV